MFNLLKKLNPFKASTKIVTFTCGNQASDRVWVKRAIAEGFSASWNGQVWKLTKVIAA